MTWLDKNKRRHWTGNTDAPRRDGLESYPAPEKIVKPRPMVIVFPRMQCPKCKGFDIETTGVKFPQRFHRCHGCNESFQSIDHGPKAAHR